MPIRDADQFANLLRDRINKQILIDVGRWHMLEQIDQAIPLIIKWRQFGVLDQTGIH